MLSEFRKISSFRASERRELTKISIRSPLRPPSASVMVILLGLAASHATFLTKSGLSTCADRALATLLPYSSMTLPPRLTKFSSKSVFSLPTSPNLAMESLVKPGRSVSATTRCFEILSLGNWNP